MNLRRILITFLGIAIVATMGYIGVGTILYRQLADISDGCSGHWANRPDQFSDLNNHWGDNEVDVRPYQMSEYEAVVFPSRETGIEISAWYVEADPAAPAVVLVHGLGSCKFAVTQLAPAGMLVRNGLNVLLIDVRDAGDSDFEDGLSAIGNEEYLDVLGAVDWLAYSRGISPDRVGIFGNSLGAATALIAFSQEPAVGAIFVDSPFDNLPQIIREELEREGYPQFLFRSGVWAGRLVSGDRLLAFDPSDAITNANGRPIYIVHGSTDDRIGVHHSRQLQEQAQQLGVSAEFWILDGVGHVQALGYDPAGYEERLVNFFSEHLRK